MSEIERTQNKKTEPRSILGLFAGVTLIAGLVSGSLAYAFNGGANNAVGPNATPTPEQLQDQTGRQVYVIPGDISDSNRGAELDDAKSFCIRVGSGPNPDGAVFNPLPKYCDTHGLHDAYYGALSPADLGQACINANGEFKFVIVDGEFREACLTGIPLDNK